MTTITREQLIKKAQEQIAFCRDTKVTGEGRAHVNQCAALFEIALAAMDSEPVYQYQSGVYNDDNGETDWYWDDCDKGFYEQYAHDRRRILYRHAQPAPELAAIVERLNLSGYEYEGGEVTPQNAAAIVDTLLQQLDDAVKGRNAQPASVVPDVLERLRSIVSDPRALPRRKEWISGQQYNYVLLENVEAMVDEACRAAMLNGDKS
ncbi:TPA: hypothetical protein ACTW7F_004006 [Klebsiella michiganensis]